MTGFDLPESFTQNPESIGRRVRPRRVPPQKFPSQATAEVILTLEAPPLARPQAQAQAAASSSQAAMGDNVPAEKMIRDYFAPSTDNIRTGPALDVGNGTFELKPGLIHMAQAMPFCGRSAKDAAEHLQKFLEVSNTCNIRGVPDDAIRLRLFPFTLKGKAKAWLYANQDEFTTWKKCSEAFLAKFFPLGKTNALRSKISEFK